MSYNVVIDASIVVKWFLPESGQEAALELLSDIEAGHATAYAPELLLAEAGKVLWQRARTVKQISAADAADALTAIVESPLRIEPMAGLMLPALAIALETGCTVYDALYVALAERADAQFVTADAKLMKKLRGTAHDKRIKLSAS